MGTIQELADQLVNRRAALDPVRATLDGVQGREGEVTDWSPAGHGARADAARDALRELDRVAAERQRDRLAVEVIGDRLRGEVAAFEEGGWRADVRVTGGPAQQLRQALDEMPTGTNEQWKVLGQRIAAVPRSLDGYIESLRAGMAAGQVAPRRQVLACIRQVRTWAGLEPGSVKHFSALVEGYDVRPSADRKTEEALRRAAGAADIAYGRLGVFLAEEYLPAAPDEDAVGRDRYVAAASHHLGDQIDVDAVYAWAWEELARWEHEVDALCEEIAPGLGRAAVVERLDGDHERWIQGERALCDWISAVLERAMRQLDGRYFDIPAALREVRVRIAPPGSAAHRYYTAPSEGFERPGTYWYPTSDRSRFPMWAEISTAYHEGVPGHHLQLGLARYLRSDLTRFQRLLTTSGLCEGWALYAERLMAEIGLLDRPEYRLDLLFSQLFRTARVIVDIGMHLRLRIPEGQPFHPGEVWTPELAQAFVERNSNERAGFAASEIVRYLGTPGHAICFKLGEQEWMAARRRAEQAAGAAFDLKAFHMSALALGPMGLARFRGAVAEMVERRAEEPDARDERSPAGSPRDSSS